MKRLLLKFHLVIMVALVAGALVMIASHTAWAKQIVVSLTLGMTDERDVPNMPGEISDDMNYNRNVVKISLARELKKIRFEPIAVGKTNFILRDSKGTKIVDYIVIVRKSDLNSVAVQIKSLLADIEGINIKVVNNKIIVDGEILLPRDMNRIINVVNQFPDAAASIVTMSPLAQKKIAEQIEKDVGNPEIHCRAVNEKFLLEGVATSESEKQKAEIIAKTYVPDVVVETGEKTGDIKKRKIDSVINLLSVKPGPEPQPGKTIKLVVHYVELQKDYERSFRFQFTPSIGDDSSLQLSTGGAAGNGVTSAITATISNLLPKLNWAKSHGHARILKSTTIIVQDGNPGIIKSTTNIPYTTQNNYGQVSTAFAEAGINTNILPTIINPKSDSVSMTITFELKNFLGDSGKGPIISNNTIQTKVTVRSTQSAAIGGLVGSDSSMDYNRLPSGVSNPIISLYASKEFQRKQSQFVVFVTPIIMNSASEGSDAVKRKFRLKD